MNRLSYIPPEKAKDSDGEHHWVDVSDDDRRYRSRSSSTTASTTFKGAARPRRTTRQRAAIPPTTPRKHIPGDRRSPGRARRERGFVVELPPQEFLGTPGPEHGHPTQQLLQEPTGRSTPQHSPPIKQPISSSIPQSNATLEPPQQPLGTTVPQCGSKADQPSKELVGTAGAELRNILATSLIQVLSFIAEVLVTVVRMMKYPISIVLAIMACAYALAIMSDAVKSAFAPMCSIPVVSLLCPIMASAGPFHPPNADPTPLWADFPGLLNVERKSLESLLDEAVEGPGLALEIKKAEMATSDLATLVRVSNLNSREILAESLSEFVKDARKVGRGLTRFSSKVGGAVDRYVYMLSALPP